MANPTVTTQLGHVDPQAAPLDINQLIDLFNTVLRSQIEGSYIPYVIGHSEPAVDDRDKAWIYLDANGKPIEIRTFYTGPNGGGWRRIYNGMPGEIRIYSGNPGLSDNPSADFDPSGKGHVLGTYDGWQLCNGKNGAPDFSDRFVVGAHMNGNDGIPGYSAGWQVVIDGVPYKDGGQWTETLLPQNIPFPTTDALTLKVGKWAADSNAHSNTGNMYGDISSDPTENRTLTLQDADPGNPSPLPVFVGPPFIAMGFIIFVGYA